MKIKENKTENGQLLSFDVSVKDFYGRIYHFDIIAEKGNSIVIKLDENIKENNNNKPLILMVNEEAKKETIAESDTLEDTRLITFVSLLEKLKSKQSLGLEPISDKEIFLLLDINNQPIKLSDVNIVQTIADIANEYQKVEKAKINKKRFKESNEQGFEYSLTDNSKYQFQYYLKNPEIYIELLESKIAQGQEAEDTFEITLLSLIEDIRNQNQDLPEELKNKKKIYIKLENQKFPILEEETYQVLADILNYRELLNQRDDEKTEQDIATINLRNANNKLNKTNAKIDNFPKGEKMAAKNFYR